MINVFNEMYGHEPKVEAIHAGVECGLFIEKLPGLDCVSYGPDIEHIHSTDERLSISSSERMYEFTCRVLETK